MTDCKFKVGENYWYRDCEESVTFVGALMGKAVFMDRHFYTFTRNLDGQVYPEPELISNLDVLPEPVREPVREPLKVEGFVWVNEHKDDTGTSADSAVFGHYVETFAQEKDAKRYGANTNATRVAVKYRVTFEEVVEWQE